MTDHFSNTEAGMGFWTGYAETREEREWAERRDYEEHQAQRDAEDVAELVDALRELRDRQNGPPLIRDAAAWEAAMAKADAVLAKYERK
jgi:hypothetical protein